jgi:hypothetical protein
MSDWQPIETAPKDGSVICCAEYWDGGWIFWPDYWRKYLEPYGEGFGGCRRPTHWMPLPEPPRPPNEIER